MDCKEIQPVHSEADQSWVFIGRTDAEAETLATSYEVMTHLEPDILECEAKWGLRKHQYARYWMLGAGALGRPRGMVWGGRRVQDGEHMYTCGGFILMFGKTNKIM